MFDLESALASWKREFAARSAGDPTALAEMGDHLREEFAALLRAGLTEPEAWSIAVVRFGDSQTIGREFAKIARLSIADRMALGLINGAGVLVIVLGLAVLFIQQPVKLLADPVLGVHVAAITLAYVAGLMAAVSAGYAGVKNFLASEPLLPLAAATSKVVRITSLITASCTALGFALGAVWANAAWGRAVDFGNLRELVAILVALCFIVVAASTWSRVVSERVGMALAVIGGGLILIAWFGAPPRNADHAWPLVGFGGFAVSVIVAAISLRARKLPTVAR
jgi:hypothetical protein